MEPITLGIITAAAALFLVFKFGKLKRVLFFDIIIDLVVTIGLGVAFFGTLGGMVIAVVAGAIVSITLYVLKLAFGYEKLTRKGWVEAEKPTFNNSKLKSFASAWRKANVR